MYFCDVNKTLMVKYKVLMQLLIYIFQEYIVNLVYLGQEKSVGIWLLGCVG